MKRRPVALLIMDGYGENKHEYGNAIRAASKPVLDRLFSQWPLTYIEASGLPVGLPAGQMGNSEVGHTNIGAGRVVYQMLTRIDRSIELGDFFQVPELVGAMEHAKREGTSLHLMGLLSDGGVHSHIDHLLALLKMAASYQLPRVYIHCFMDGRDADPRAGVHYLRRVKDYCEACGTGQIATVVGRYYAMDRDSRWPRTQKAYDAVVMGEGQHGDPIEAMHEFYRRNITDEFVEPVICCENGTIQENDAVIFFNIRPDRARQLTRALVDPEFLRIQRPKDCFATHFVTMVQYDSTMPHVEVAFKPVELNNTLGAYLSKMDKTQLRIAETEKYAHVTFFFNGGVEMPCRGEDRALIPSPKVATYDLKPEMSAGEIADEMIRRIHTGRYDVMILNFANCDMVGHTGVFRAAVEAVEAVDHCVGRVVDALMEAGGVALITADHGNADIMINDDGTPCTTHTTNPVPFCVVGQRCTLRPSGALCDIAPTILQLLGLPQPEEMTGTSLIAQEG